MWQRECSVVCAHTVFSKWNCCLLPRTHSTDTPTTFSAYPLHSLNFRNMTLSLTFLFKWFLSSLMSGPAPSVQPFPCGTDTAQDRAGRWQLSQDWTLPCPGANRLSWGADCQRHLPPQPCAKIQMCKILKSRSVELEMNFTSQAVKSSSNFTIPYISKKKKWWTEVKYFFFLQHPSKIFP